MIIKPVKLIGTLLAAAMLLSIAACGDTAAEGGTAEDTTTTTTTARTTMPPNEGVIEEIGNLAGEVEAEELEVTKKIKWLAWYEIDETQANVELFKQLYGIPEQGSADYPEEEADHIFTFQNVAYADRYTLLANLIQSGDSPDMFPFEIQNFPYSIYQNLFQSIDGIIDTNTEEWEYNRDVLDMFMWNGKNYCPIIDVLLSTVLFYRRSVVEEAGLDDPYDLYKAGEWTWDTFTEMCADFSSPEDGLYAIDGFYVENSMIATTGVPLVSNVEGKLRQNFFDANVERCMELLSDFSREEYRYPFHLLNNFQPSLRAWANGETLFYNEGTWAFEGDIKRYKDRDGWGDDEVMLVPFPRDPNADEYYQLLKHDSFMLVSGAENIDGFKAYTLSTLACAKNPDVAAASRAQAKENFGWTDEQLDLIEEMKTLSPVFDFKNGLGEDISSTGASENPIERLTRNVYIYGTESYTQLREAGLAEIEERIEELNNMQ